ncbi:Hypothetical_protein [Hexamita inflata]|uniref:Hypothetical_protein n=1 Tax=Hexamita inflata TaxID=28002 RepID=A0AA86UKG1_9EUKA|nr:Hypothetical protein HINF_LOCUS49410 [Hexamita inflata]
MKQQFVDTTKLKVNRIYQGDNVIDLSTPSKILFTNDQGQKRFINPTTGDNDFKLDLTQLEGITIGEMTINKFWSNEMYASGINVGLNLNDLMKKCQQFRIDINVINEWIQRHTDQILQLQNQFQVQYSLNQEVENTLVDIESFIQNQENINTKNQEDMTNLLNKQTKLLNQISKYRQFKTD